jgi:RNA-directed DNA polymerase
VIRYADDLVALGHSRDQAERVKAELGEWLAPRGLRFNEDKTRIVHASHGFDFLGFNVRRYRDSKLLIKPSAKAVRRFRERLATEMRALRGSNAAAVIARLAPITRGWAAYYRGVVSSKLFASLDHYLFKLTYKWAKRSHANKPTSWIVDRYYGKFNRFRNDRWVFGDRDSGAYLPKLAWTGIVRHIPVKGGASPDDPDLAEYWAERRRKVKPPLGEYRLRVLSKHGALRVVRGPPAARRQAAPIPARLGTVAAQRHPHGDGHRPFRRSRATRPNRRCPQPPRTRHLPPGARRPRRQTARTAPASPSRLA